MFVPPEARSAASDQDGTTWVSHPMYTQVVYCLDRVPAVVRAKLLNDDNAGKPQGIHLMIGRRPHATFGKTTTSACG